MEKKSARERVIEKLSLAQDLKESKVKTSIESIEQVDGKIKASFSIMGLPVEKSKKDPVEYYISSYKDIPKIFNCFSTKRNNHLLLIDYSKTINEETYTEYINILLKNFFTKYRTI